MVVGASAAADAASATGSGGGESRSALYTIRSGDGPGEALRERNGIHLVGVLRDTGAKPYSLGCDTSPSAAMQVQMQMLIDVRLSTDLSHTNLGRLVVGGLR